jgi:hypothetical protein
MLRGLIALTFVWAASVPGLSPAQAQAPAQGQQLILGISEGTSGGTSSEPRMRELLKWLNI